MSLGILFVDDDRSFSSLACAALQREGFRVQAARSLHEARLRLASEAPELVVLDRRLPDGDGLELLPELKAQYPSALVLMVTAHGDIASAVDAIRAGASDYLSKPIELSELVMKARQAVGSIRIRDRLEQAEAALQGRRPLVQPVSQPMKRVLEMLERIATSPRSPVLLLGETGVGKEALARYVHGRGCGEGAPFVHLNCAALPESTFESELFGHERGAFTDARSARRGLVEVANGGTLFLDEVGELPLALQAKLLTFLDSGRFRRLGGTTEQSSSARIVAATNRDLQADIAAGRFREDLWFRLGVFRIEVPPLRDRPEDIEVLAEGLLAHLRQELGRREARLSKVARERLLAYSFPGNVRELRNLIERALVLEPGPELELDVLADVPQRDARHFQLEGPVVPLEEVEKRYARWALAQLDGRRMEAARALGISYPTFLKRIGESAD